MVNKKTAQKIFLEIKKANKILLALHVSPDPDSLCSVLALDLILNKLGKKTKIISYSPVPSELKIFPCSEKIEMADFSKVNHSEYDLFFALDSASKDRITRSSFPEKFPKTFKIIDIDHHVYNEGYGDINIIENVSSTSEILYELFNCWKIKIEKNLAQLLFYGICSDSGCFQYFGYVSPRTLVIGSELMEKGASLRKVVLNVFKSYSLKTLKYWGKVLDNMNLDPSRKFIWSKISRREREELGVESSDIMAAATLFAGIVKGTEFGIILNEEDNLVRGSLRARDDFDTTKIASELGGGGHPQSSGFYVSLSLEEAEKKVLEVARKYIKTKEV